MIDRTTLPQTTAGEYIEKGRRFEVIGQNFDLWPEEIVLGYDATVVETSEITGYLLILVEKSNTKMVFEARRDMIIPTRPHQWSLFGSPFEQPRTFLTYES